MRGRAGKASSKRSKLSLLTVAAISVVSLVEAFDSSSLDLLSNFLALLGDGPIGMCNFFVCSETGVMDAVKKTSSTFLCTIRVQHPNEQFRRHASHHRQISVIDLDCRHARDYLTQTSDLGFLRTTHAWLLLHSSTSKDSVETILNRLDLSINSAVYLAEKLPNGRYRLSGLYRNVRDLVREDFGTLPEEESSPVNRSITLPWAIRRQDLKGKKLRTAVVATSNGTLEDPDNLKDTHIDSISKLGNFILKLIVKRLNATIDYHVSDIWGSKLENGSFSGIVGIISRGEADIGGTQMFPNDDRLRILYFIETPVATTVKFIFMSPPLSFSRNIFTAPFDRDVWISLCVLVCLLILLLYLVLRIEVSDEEESDVDGTPTAGSVGEVVLTHVAVICQQGYPSFRPTGIAGRMLAITLLFSTIFLSVSYSAHIMVLLQATDTSIKTLKDLVESNFHLAAQEISYNRAYGTTATEPVRKKIMNKILWADKRENFMTIEEGVEKIRSRVYAFLAEPSPVYHTLKKSFGESESCGLQELREAYFSDVLPMWSVKKNYTYTEMLRIIYRALEERGHHHRIRSRLYMRKKKCGRKQASYTSVGLVHVQRAFHLLTAGMAISLLLLIAEMLLHRLSAFSRKRTAPAIFEYVD